MSTGTSFLKERSLALRVIRFTMTSGIILVRSNSRPGVGSRRRLVGKKRGKLAKAAFCPFSIGPRACVAKNLAWVELSLIIARTAFRYDMRLPEDHVSLYPDCCAALGSLAQRSPEYQLKAWIASGREGPWVQFRHRAGSVC
ncbi:unnamed protein product [Penicillium salamii]|nr:unnamed protein product [Penicillium salamii]CAG8377531.1 unnamed protein product [Penicillium salamii]